MARPPFTVGLIQDAASANRDANLADSVTAIREAHRRGEEERSHRLWQYSTFVVGAGACKPAG